MERSLEAIKGWIQGNIREGGGRVGGWKPLADATLKRKRRGGWPPNPLIRTGKLRDDWRARVIGKRGHLKAGAPYAVFHQRGTRFMPARKLLPTNRQAEELIKPIWGRHVNVSIRG